MLDFITRKYSAKPKDDKDIIKTIRQIINNSVDWDGNRMVRAIVMQEKKLAVIAKKIRLEENVDV